MAQDISSQDTPPLDAGTAASQAPRDGLALPGTPENPLHKVATVPNLITLCRLVLTVAFLFMFPHERLRRAAIAVYIVAACTDWVDGQVARRFRQVSVFGKRFDPVMDRVLIFSGILALAIGRLIPTWVVVFLVARDAYLLAGGAVLKATRGVIVDVCYIGKACTFVLMAGFAVVMLGLFPVPGLGVAEVSWLPGVGSEPVSLGMWAIYVGCCLSFAAACVYTARGVRVFRDGLPQGAGAGGRTAA